jgi:hypothetical protein
MRERIAWINSMPDLEFVKNIYNHRTKTLSCIADTLLGQFKEEYGIDILMIKGEYSYMFGFGAHRLDIPELFPMVEKVLASFHTTR